MSGKPHSIIFIKNFTIIFFASKTASQKRVLKYIAKLFTKPHFLRLFQNLDYYSYSYFCEMICETTYMTVIIRGEGLMLVSAEEIFIFVMPECRHARRVIVSPTLIFLMWRSEGFPNTKQTQFVTCPCSIQ